MSKYVSDQILGRVQQATDILSLVRDIVPLKKAGTGFVGLCPFHREKTGSFHVNPERQIFKCFGCGVGGDVFTFIMKLNGVTFPEAIRILAERAHIELPESEYHGGEQGERTKLFEVNAWAAEMYSRWLMTEVGKPALDYLLKRGLTMETIKQFKIGYSPDSWDALQKLAARKKYGAALLLKAGLAASKEESDRVYDRFRNRLMFPIRDNQDHVIGFGARSLDGSEPKYLNSPETPLFSKGRTLYGIDRARAGMRETHQVIVVEGYMDVVMAHQYGITWTVAVLGTALSAEHVRVLRRLADEAILLFDSDAAGQSSASRSIDAFVTEELPARVVTLPDGLDPDEYLLKEGAEAFKECLRGGVDGVTFKLRRALESSGADGAAQMPAKALDDVLATVALIPNPVTQMLELRKVAGRTGVPEYELQRRMQTLTEGRRSWAPEAESPAQNPNATRDLERELLLAILTYPQTIPLVQERFDARLLANREVRALIERACKLAASEPDSFDAAHLLLRTQEEALRVMIEQLLGQKTIHVNEPELWCRELLAALEARAHRAHGRELHRKLSTSAEPSTEELNERLRALREAHRTQGTLAHKQRPAPKPREGISVEPTP